LVDYWQIFKENIMHQHKGKSVNTQLGENSLPTTVTTTIISLLCKTCGETKPKKDFHRVLTLAQSKALLRKPNLTTRHTLYSTLCRDCRNQRKRRTPLSIKELRNKITSGDMNPIIGEALITEKREALPRKRSKVMKEYWQKKKLGWQDELKTNLQTQVTAYANRYYSYKNQMPEDPTPLQHAMLDQHSYNYAEAKRIRQDLLEQASSGREISPDIKINEVIKRRKVGA
jgi:hypothetical protein